MTDCAWMCRDERPCRSVALIDGYCPSHFLVVRENGRRAEREQLPMDAQERKAFLKAEKARNETADAREPLRTR